MIFRLKKKKKKKKIKNVDCGGLKVKRLVNNKLLQPNRSFQLFHKVKQ